MAKKAKEKGGPAYTVVPTWKPTKGKALSQDEKNQLDAIRENIRIDQLAEVNKNYQEITAGTD